VTALTDSDYKRALQLLLFTVDGVDAAGVNHVFQQISDEERAGQAILALCEVTQLIIRESSQRHPGLHDELLATIRKTLLMHELNGFTLEGED
jgi:hypothetical protein